MYSMNRNKKLFQVQEAVPQQTAKDDGKGDSKYVIFKNTA